MLSLSKVSKNGDTVRLLSVFPLSMVNKNADSSIK